MQAIAPSRSRNSLSVPHLDLSSLPRFGEVQEIGSVIINMPDRQGGKSLPLNTRKVEEVKTEDESSIKKKQVIKTLNALSVKEEDALKKISEYKKDAITAAAGILPGIIVGAAVSTTAGPFWGVLAGVFCGGTCAAAVRWKFMPHVIKIILKEEYKGNLNELFENNLKKYIMDENKELDKSYHGHLLLTAFKVNIPKRAANPIFSLEEVEEFLKMDLFDSSPAEKYFNFWAGDVIGDFETTEKVNRALIAHLQGLIESLEEALEEHKNAFSEEEIRNVSNVISMLKDKLPSYLKNFARNHEQLHIITTQCFKKKKDFVEALQLRDVKINRIELESGSAFGSLNQIRSPDFKKLDLDKNSNYKEKAFAEPFPPAYISGEWKEMIFKRRVVDKIAYNATEVCFDIEYSVRKSVIEYEMGYITKKVLFERTERLVSENPLPQAFKSEMLGYVYYILRDIDDNNTKGYFKVEDSQ